MKRVNLASRAAAQQIDVGADVNIEFAQRGEAMIDARSPRQLERIKDCIWRRELVVLACQKNFDAPIGNQAAKHSFIDDNVMRVPGEKENLWLSHAQRTPESTSWGMVGIAPRCD